MSRSERRASLARYRQEVAHKLATYLVEPDDPRLSTVPILQRAARSWLDALPRRMKSCICCSGLMWEKQRVGWLLLSIPAVEKPPAASVCGICCECADLPMQALEKAATKALQVAVPNGRFKPMGTSP